MYPLYVEWKDIIPFRKKIEDLTLPLAAKNRKIIEKKRLVKEVTEINKYNIKLILKKIQQYITTAFRNEDKSLIPS